MKPPLPAIGGTEALGVVDKLGEGVTTPAVGQRVTASSIVGAWAEYFIARAAAVVPVPDAISDEVACQLIAMPLSAMMALVDLGVKPGQWMIQNAATGAVGKTLAMIAKAKGIHVVNIVRRREGVAELGKLGIEHVVSTANSGWQKRVEEIIGGAPIVAALNSVGGEESGQLLRMLGQGGLLMTFGALANQPMIVSPGDLIFKQATIRGFWAAKLGSGPHQAEIPQRDQRARPSRGRRLAETDCRTSFPPRGSSGSRPRQRSAGANGQDRASGVRESAAQGQPLESTNLGVLRLAPTQFLVGLDGVESARRTASLMRSRFRLRQTADLAIMDRSQLQALRPKTGLTQTGSTHE